MDGASDAHFDAVEREVHRRLRRVSNVRAAEALMPAIRQQQARLATEIAAVIGQTSRPQLFEALPALLALACDVVGDQPYRSGFASDGLRALVARLELAAAAEDQCAAEQISVAAACILATIALQVGRDMGSPGQAVPPAARLLLAAPSPDDQRRTRR